MAQVKLLNLEITWKIVFLINFNLLSIFCKLKYRINQKLSLFETPRMFFLMTDRVRCCCPAWFTHTEVSHHQKEHCGADCQGAANISYCSSLVIMLTTRGHVISVVFKSIQIQTIGHR